MGDPTIDTSTDESISESSQKVKESLPESQRAEFDEALQILAFSQLDMSDILSDETGDIQERMMNSLNGKTAQEIMAEANKIQLEREIREKTSA